MVPARTGRPLIPSEACKALVPGAVAEDMTDTMKDPKLHRTLAANWLETERFARSIVTRMALDSMRIDQVAHTKLTSEAHRKTALIKDVLACSGSAATLKDSVPVCSICWKMLPSAARLCSSNGKNLGKTSLQTVAKTLRTLVLHSRCSSASALK